MAKIERTVFRKMEVGGAGSASVMLSLEIYDEDSGKVFSSENHRMSIEPGESVAAVAARTNTYLVASGYPEIPADVVVRVGAHRALEADLAADAEAVLAAAVAAGVAEQMTLSTALAAKTDEAASLAGDLSAAQAELDALRPQVIDGVPQEVAMNKARKALILAGLMDQVEAAIAAVPAPEGDLLRADWQYASGMKRQAPFVVAMAAALGLSDEQVDALFIQAAALP